MRSGRRNIDRDVIAYRVNKWDELATYLTRAFIVGALSWLIWTTNNSAGTLALLEWRVMQLELGMHSKGNP